MLSMGAVATSSRGKARGFKHLARATNSNRRSRSAQDRAIVSRAGPLLSSSLLIVLAVFAAPASGAERATGPSVSGSKSSASEETILGGVSCTNDVSCMAVGSFGGGIVDEGTLAEQWDGTAWSVLPTPNPTDGSNLHSVSCIASNACTAVGSAGFGGPLATLAESWDGTSWSIQSTPNPTISAGLNGVSCVSSSFCMAVGTAAVVGGDHSAFSEEWNGSDWSVVSVALPNEATDTNLANVSCVSQTSCVAVGGSNAPQAPTLAEFWDGTTWTVEPTPNPHNASKAYLNDVSCSAEDSCVAIGPEFSETWDGSQWSFEHTAKVTGGHNDFLDGVSCPVAIAPESCIGVGEYVDDAGRVSALAEAWNGSSWSVQNTAQPAHQRVNLLGGVSCPEAGSCVATGYYQPVHGSPAVALTEFWNGTSWVLAKRAPLVPVRVTPSSGPPAAALVISTLGSPPGSTVTVVYRAGISSSRAVTLCSGAAAPNGSFSCDATVPSRKNAGPEGAHTVVAQGGGLSWSTTFTLK
jgi:hypothetical protein